jgi:hypothetical protein
VTCKLYSFDTISSNEKKYYVKNNTLDVETVMVNKYGSKEDNFNENLIVENREEDN